MVPVIVPAQLSVVIGIAGVPLHSPTVTSAKVVVMGLVISATVEVRVAILFISSLSIIDEVTVTVFVTEGIAEQEVVTFTVYSTEIPTPNVGIVGQTIVPIYQGCLMLLQWILQPKLS